MTATILPRRSTWLRSALLAGATCASLGALAAAEADAAVTCRGSAAKLGTAGVPQDPASEPTVANRNADPCVTDRAEAASAQPSAVASADAPQASTEREPGSAAASARVASATVTLGGVRVTLGPVEANRALRCSSGSVAVEESSRVEGVQAGPVGGPQAAVSLPNGASGDNDIQILGQVRLRTNQTVGDSRVAAVLEAVGQTVVLAEARASAGGCDELSGPSTNANSGSGSGGTPEGGGNAGDSAPRTGTGAGAPGTGQGGGGNGLDTAGICAPGSDYDTDRKLCVIRGAEASGADLVVGAPYDGPRGGRIVTLAAARRLLGARARTCLSGPGPRFAIVGTRGADRITGTNRADRIYGLGGNDRLDGGRGNDCLDGNGGRDILSGALGIDRQYGGPGNDAVNGGSGFDRLFGEVGNDTINAGFGGDLVMGGAGRDAINVSTAGPAARVNCGTGRDRLRGNRNERRAARRCEERSFLR